MRKEYTFECEIHYPDAVEIRSLTVHAMNEEKARKLFKQDICNLKYCYESQLKNIRRI